MSTFNELIDVSVPTFSCYNRRFYSAVERINDLNAISYPQLTK